jgi:LPXTG-motif cell wall-anchored protein
MMESGRYSPTRNSTERGTVRRLLLFTVLSMVATLVFVPTALAQQSGPASNFLEVPEGTPPCPLGLDEVKEIYGPNVTCGEGGGYVLADSDSSTPPATTSGTPDVQNQITQVGEGNIACVQTAVQQQVGNTQVAASQSGDATNFNVQNISQECNISVNEAETAVKYLPVKKYASATATAAPVVQYKKYYSPAPAVQYEYSASPTASASASYSAAASASSAPAAELPSTGGSSLIALGAGVLLVAGGLLARRIVR